MARRQLRTQAAGSMGRMRSAEMATVAKGAKAGVDWRNVKLDISITPLCCSRATLEAYPLITTLINNHKHC